MSRLLTPEEFIKKLEEKNANIEALDQYISAITKLRFRCRICGNVWETKPSTILSGHGCPECGKRKVGNALRKTNAQFIDELKKINPNIEVLGDYSGKQAKLPLRCLKCGYTWNSAPHDLLGGHGCPQCGYEKQRTAQLKTQQQFIDDLKKVNPNIEALDEYINNHTKIRFRCKVCGHTWKTVPNSVLLGHGCSFCARSSTSFFEQTIIHAFRACLGKDAVKSRDRSLINMELDVYIPSLKVAFEPGSWAWHEDKIKQDGLKREKCHAVGVRLVMIYTDYKNKQLPFDDDCYGYFGNLGIINWSETKDATNKLLAEYNLSLSANEWEQVKQSALEMSGKRTHGTFIKELSNTNPTIKALDHYVDSSAKMRFQCTVCGYEWETIPLVVLHGHGCPKCSKKRAARKRELSHERFIEKLKQINPNVEVTGTYVQSKVKIPCRCLVCGNEWEMSPNHLLHGQGCPKCSKLKAAQSRRKSPEQFAQELSERNPYVDLIDRYKDCKTKVQVRCRKCGYEWFVNPMDALAGHGCPKCKKHK